MFQKASRYFGNLSNTSNFYILLNGDCRFVSPEKISVPRWEGVRVSNSYKIDDQWSSLAFVLLTSKKLLKDQMFRVSVLLTIVERSYVQGVRNFFEIGEGSNVLDFPRGHPRFCRGRQPTLLCTPKGRQLFGRWSLHEELLVLRTFREVIGARPTVQRSTLNVQDFPGCHCLHYHWHVLTASDRSNVDRWPSVWSLRCRRWTPMNDRLGWTLMNLWISILICRLVASLGWML